MLVQVVLFQEHHFPIRIEEPKHPLEKAVEGELGKGVQHLLDGLPLFLTVIALDPLPQQFPHHSPRGAVLPLAQVGVKMRAHVASQVQGRGRDDLAVIPHHDPEEIRAAAFGAYQEHDPARTGIGFSLQNGRVPDSLSSCEGAELAQLRVPGVCDKRKIDDSGLLRESVFLRSRVPSLRPTAWRKPGWPSSRPGISRRAGRRT